MTEDKYLLNCLKLINETDIECKRRNKKDFTRDLLIQEMLKDEKIFQKVSKEKAYKILNALDIKNEEKVYKKLIVNKS